MIIEKFYTVSPKQKEDFEYNNLIIDTESPMVMRLDVFVSNIPLSDIEVIYHRLILNHELLRSIFTYDNNHLKQCVFKFDSKYFPLEKTSEDNLIRALEKGKLSLRSIERLPPIRVLILDKDKLMTHIIILLHHIISDRSTIFIIKKELKENFIRYSNNLNLIENNLPQYGSFWKTYFEKYKVKINQDITYWKNRLKTMEWATDFTYFSKVDRKNWDFISDYNITQFHGGYSLNVEMSSVIFEKLEMLKKGFNFSFFIIILTLFRAFYFYKTGKVECIIQSHFEDYNERTGMIGNFLKKILHFHKFEFELSVEDQLFSELQGYYDSLERPIYSSEPFRENFLISRSFLFINYIEKKEEGKKLYNIGSPVVISKVESPIVCLIHSYPKEIFMNFSFNDSYFDFSDVTSFVNEFNSFVIKYLDYIPKKYEHGFI